MPDWSGQPEVRARSEGDSHKVSLDDGLARRELGWAPTVELGDGLIKTMECFRNQFRGLA